NDSAFVASHPDVNRATPIDVYLKMNGNIMSPEIGFEININDYPNYIEVEQAVLGFESRIKYNEQELNKQVFSLIVLKKLSPLDDFSMNLSSTASTNVSEMFTNQLGYMLSQLDEDLDVYIDLGNLNGDLDFEFIEVKMITENYIGASANLNVLKIESFSDGSSIQLESPTLASPFVIGAATESQNQNQPVIPATSEIVFDESNSNIDKIVESRPNSLAFDFEMIINGSNTSQDDGFIYLDYGVNSELQVEIPVSFKAKNIFIQDTVDVSLSVPDIIENGSFSIIVNNGFPFTAEFKMQLMNEDGTLLTELESESIVQASELDANGLTIQSTRSNLRFPFEDLSNVLNNTTQIGIEATLNTEPYDQFVKLYSDYNIDFTIIANFETLISEETFE
ncbi:MAG: hypothetical protein P8N00_00140, partial [Flavobacteriales bacterium]|nr:hypothetical protein [Flavobacteriales bacterium]